MITKDGFDEDQLVELGCQIERMAADYDTEYEKAIRQDMLVLAGAAVAAGLSFVLVLVVLL